MLAQLPFGVGEAQTPQQLNVLIVYEDFETGKRAKRTYDYLVDHLGGDWHLDYQMWKFDILQIPKLREIALKDALAADIVIFSQHGDRDLPESVESWVNLWLRKEPNAVALVALFDEQPASSARAALCRDYLANVAKRGKMDFFSQTDVWPEPGDLSAKRVSRGAERAFTLLADVVQQSPGYARWGLNE